MRFFFVEGKNKRKYMGRSNVINIDIDRSKIHSNKDMWKNRINTNDMGQMYNQYEKKWCTSKISKKDFVVIVGLYSAN